MLLLQGFCVWYQCCCLCLSGNQSLLWVIYDNFVDSLENCISITLLATLSLEYFFAQRLTSHLSNSKYQVSLRLLNLKLVTAIFLSN